MKKLPKPPRMPTLRKLPTKHPTKKSIPVPAFDTNLGSHIQDHSYDPKTGHLTVTFAGGRKYQYHGVDKETAAGLEGADSVGRYLHANVIGKFRHTKL